MSLSTEQLLLLNTLIYTRDFSKYQTNGKTTIGTIADGIWAEISASESKRTEFSNQSFQALEVLEAIRSDPALCQVELKETFKGELGCSNVLLHDPATNEAVVLFQGTGSDEWKDNFTAGSEVSSQAQEEALTWYQSLDLDSYDTVTVTGHSKGGNKAKYITVLDNSVDRCVSFDGQGFSDEFMEAYSDQIARNQGKVENHIKDYDYVNLLLNDLGKQTFYKGTELDSIIANHYPASMLEFGKDGYHMTATERPEEMKALDEFLNGYLRTLSKEDKQEILEALGDAVRTATYLKNEGISTDPKSDILKILTAEGNQDRMANLIAYLLEYQKAKPEFADQIAKVLKQYDLEEGVGDMITGISDAMEAWWFEPVLAIATGLSWGLGKLFSHLPDWLADAVRSELEKIFGMSLTNEEIEAFLMLLCRVAQERGNVKINEDGGDRTVETELPVGSCYIRVSSAGLAEGMDGLADVKNRLNDCIERLEGVSFEGILGKVVIDSKLRRQREKLEDLSAACESMRSVLLEIKETYESTEAGCAQVG